MGGWIRTVKQSDCAVDIARQEVHVLRQKSCGKCTFCREGLYQIEQIFNGTASGRAEMKDLELADEIGKAMEVSCNCTLGDRAAFRQCRCLKPLARRQKRISEEKSVRQASVWH